MLEFWLNSRLHHQIQLVVILWLQTRLPLMMFQIHMLIGWSIPKIPPLNLFLPHWAAKTIKLVVGFDEGEIHPTLHKFVVSLLWHGDSAFLGRSKITFKHPKHLWSLQQQSGLLGICASHPDLKKWKCGNRGRSELHSRCAYNMGSTKESRSLEFFLQQPPPEYRGLGPPKAQTLMDK